MIWLLVTLLVVVPTVLVVLLALSTKRHLTVVAAQVGGRVAQVTDLLDQAQQALPPAPPTCPTCGQRTPGPVVTTGAPVRSR